MIVLLAPSPHDFAGRFACAALDLIRARTGVERVLCLNKAGMMAKVVAWCTDHKVELKVYRRETNILRMAATEAALRSAILHGKPDVAIVMAPRKSRPRRTLLLCLQAGVPVLQANYDCGLWRDRSRPPVVNWVKLDAQARLPSSLAASSG